MKANLATATIDEIRPPTRIITRLWRTDTDITITEEQTDAVLVSVFVHRTSIANVCVE
jgi:hypothetical protein